RGLLLSGELPPGPRARSHRPGVAARGGFPGALARGSVAGLSGALYSEQGRIASWQRAADHGPRTPRMIDLRAHGLINPGTIHATLSPAELVEQAVRRGEGLLADNGAFVAYTGEHTGRSPRDRFVVAEPPSQDALWWGPVNRPLEPAAFRRLLDKAHAYLQGRELFAFDGWACADPRYRLPVRVFTEKAWHALFSRCLL